MVKYSSIGNATLLYYVISVTPWIEFTLPQHGYIPFIDMLSRSFVGLFI